MFTIEYLCPRESPEWQMLTEGFLFWRSPREFPDFLSARLVCDGLVWQYHAARILDPHGNRVYQI